MLIGAPLTDVKITLIAGRAHLKHTEGGDFRQATYRAVRQGLMMADQIHKTQLLEPWYAFRLELPSDNVGRAMNDIQNMGGSFDPPETGADGDTTLLTGTAPASTMRSYPMEVVGYTRGRGHLTLTLDGYRPCHNAAEVIELRAMSRNTISITRRIRCSAPTGPDLWCPGNRCAATCM